MSYSPMIPAIAQQLTESITTALHDSGLSPHLKRIWVYRERCLVVDFTYRRVSFGFDLTPVSESGLSVDLVLRGPQRNTFDIFSVTKKKNSLAFDIAPHDAVAKVMAKVPELTTHIDRYLALNDRKVKSALPREPALRKTRKVGVLTLPLSKNFGNNLQAYALMQTLRDLDCDPVLINRRYVGRGSAERAQKRKQADVPAITNKINIEADCENRSFIEANILPITRTFRSSAQLKNHLGEYNFDAVIVGSDQIWRAKYALGLLSDFFHGYIDAQDRSIKRISYAASFGADSWEFTDEQTEKASALLKLFDGISVREDSAVDLCRDNLGAEAQLVLDPTLLLTPARYLSLFSERLGTGTGRRITSYILDPSTEKKRLIGEVADQLEVGVISAAGESNSGAGVADKSVEGWLASFYQADYVVTDSFHGVAFSILFNKPFLAFGNVRRGIARFTSILKMFGLEDRLVLDANAANIEKLLQPIDWIAVNQRLDHLRRQSIRFLRDTLALSPGADSRSSEGSPPALPVNVADVAANPAMRTSPEASAKTAISTVTESNALNVMCTGCGVCVSESHGGLTMGWDQDGFWAPKATGQPVPPLAVRVCPFNPAPEPSVADEDALGQVFHGAAPNFHPRSGRFQNSYIGYSKAFRESSSSGGIATYVFDQLLQRKEIDYLFVVQGDAEIGYRYRVFDGKDSIEAISKTRYFPVTMEDLFATLEQTDGRVGVSGVACFIKALRLKQHYHPELKKKIPFLVGIICGGLKSRHYTDFLAESAGIRGEYSQAQYRIKNPKSDANDYFFSAQDSGTNTRQIRMRPLGDMWGSGLFKNKACDFCTDVLTELADISLGDAWIPQYNRDGMGNSVVVTRSALADRIIREGISAGDLVMTEAPIEQVVRSQGGGVNHKMNAMKFRLWISRNFTALPVPACRTSVGNEITAGDMLVQILRERVRSKSLRFWRENSSSSAFNRRMRSSRQLLQAVTTARKKQPDAVYEALASALAEPQVSRRHNEEMSVLLPLLRWLERKVSKQEIDLSDLVPLLSEAQRVRAAALVAVDA